MPTEEEMKAQRARFINEEIQELFLITLVTCPECSAIHSSYDYTKIAHPLFPKSKWWVDCRCWNWFFCHDAPDLFY